MLKKMPETRLTIDVASLILEKIEEEKWEKFKEKKVGKSKKKVGSPWHVTVTTRVVKSKSLLRGKSLKVS